FMEYARELPQDRPPKERVKDWNEFHLPMAPEKLQIQGARCMDCGIPFCQTGEMINHAASGCPLGNLIPEWNTLVYENRWKEAYYRLSKTNNFPEFTGRVCPAPCEGSCCLGIHEPAVTICNIEYSIIERAFQEGWVKATSTDVRTGKRIAVVGSGPAGLACADQLNKVDHNVTVYERSDRIGGLLMYGIPNMKLDKKVVQRRIDLMKEEGVLFITNTEIGKDILASQLLEEYDAVVLCGGATKPRDLPVEGRDANNIYFAMEYLHGNTKKLLDERGNATPDDELTFNPPFISATGKDIIVIGGGDTGTDCVGTALRHGCKSVTQFEILSKPPLQRPADNPWPEWPRIFRVDYGQEEAAAIQGEDPRTFDILTKKFEKYESGNVKAIHTVQIEWVDGKTGGPPFREIPGTEKVWPAQMVLLALGFLGPEAPIARELNIECDERSNIKAEYGKYQSSIPGVFAAGDARRGQSLVVWAIHEGREAAREVDRYLMGETELP
ncbi:MAG: glutamate synthase subunit beta, partial [Calditrichaeota bacterium]